jgi:hypothetical protein
MLAYTAYVGVGGIPVSYCMKFERWENMVDSVILVPLSCVAVM